MQSSSGYSVIAAVRGLHMLFSGSVWEKHKNIVQTQLECRRECFICFYTELLFVQSVLLAHEYANKNINPGFACEVESFETW